MSDPENPFASEKSDDQPNRRAFGLWSCVALVVANMIGAGVYTSSGFALGDLGDRSLVMCAWLVGGLIAFTGAISYGGLSKHLTESGGEYLFLSRNVHPLAGFMAGWVSLIAGFTGAIAFAALGFATYAAPDHPEYTKAIAIGAVLVFGLLHLIREPGVVVQNAVVIIKLIAICGLILFAAMKVGSWPGRNIDAVPTAEFDLTKFATTVMWFSLSYSGYNAAVYISGEVKDAEYNVPRSMWIATLVVTLLYLILNFVFVFGPLPADVTFQKEVALIASEAVGGRTLATLIQSVICLSLASSISSMVIAGPRVYAKMAEDGIFPRLFRFQGNNATGAILLQVILAIVVVSFTTLKELIDYLSLILSVSTAAAVASLFALQMKGESVKFPGFPFVPAFYVIVTLVLAAIRCTTQDSAGQWLATIGTIVSGLVAYAIFSRKRPA